MTGFFFLGALMVFILSAVPLDAAEIQGRVTMEPPYPVVQKFIAKPKRGMGCGGGERVSESLMVSQDGGVQNAVVWIDGEFAPMEIVGIPVLDQKNCRFDPHVSLVPAGTPVSILNSDPEDHDVRIFDGAVMKKWFEMAPGQESVQTALDRPGIYVIRCGFHPWMHGFVIAAAHRHYAVTDSDGSFLLKDVPPGAHRLHIWHEKLGETGFQTQNGEFAAVRLANA